MVPSTEYGPMGASKAPPLALILRCVSPLLGSTYTSSTVARWSPGSTTLASADVDVWRGPMHPNTVARLYTNGGRVSGTGGDVVGSTLVGGAVVGRGCPRAGAAFTSGAK